MSKLAVALEHEGRKYTSSVEAAAHAGKSRQTIYNWIDKGKVKGIRRAGFLYVEIDSLLAYLKPVPTSPA